MIETNGELIQKQKDLKNEAFEHQNNLKADHCCKEQDFMETIDQLRQELAQLKSDNLLKEKNLKQHAQQQEIQLKEEAILLEQQLRQQNQ